MTSGQTGAVESVGSGGDGQAGLFQGMSFWLSHNVPQRNRFKEQIQRHGGTVKLLEQDAGVRLVDHKRKDLPDNVYSYQFVEKSIQKGRLEDLDTHKAGPSTPRPAGGTHIPAKNNRSAYTIDEDQAIWDYMQALEKDSSVSIRGNKIYKDFGAKYTRHPWQSIRDRYLKRLRDRPRPGALIPQPTAPTTINHAARQSSPSRVATSRASMSQAVEVAAQRIETPSRPQERKRKRSLDPTATPERASTGTSTAQFRRPTVPPGAQQSSDLAVPPSSLLQKSRQERLSSSESMPSDTSKTQGKSPSKYAHAEVLAPPTPRTQRRESPHDENPPSPKKAKIASRQASKEPREQTTETRTPQTPTAEVNTDDNLLWELPFFPSSPVTEVTPEQDIDSWIDDRLREGRGTEAQIIEALQCTSMDPALADEVLESLVLGKGIPTDTRGVWTAKDDRCLEADNSRDVQRVLDKHGDLLNSRWEYLQMAREALSTG